MQFVDADKFSNFCKRCITLFDYELIALSFSVVALVISIFVLALLYCKFRNTAVITKRTKWILIKVSALFLTIDAAFIGDAIVAASVKDYTYTLSIVQSIFFTIVKLTFVLALIVLMYSNTKCLLCTATDRTPLLIPSEKQHTNPASVWDHANDPSYTQSYHPRDMSDCETDTRMSLQ